MTPITDPLAGLERPPGDPDGMAAMAATYSGGAESLGRTSQVLVGMAGRLLAQAWSGQAAAACAAAATKNAAAIATAADGYLLGGEALRSFAGKLRAAQTAYDQARTMANNAMADEREQQLQAQETPFGGAPSLTDLAGLDPLVPLVSPLRAAARAQAEQAIEDAKAAATAAAGTLSGTLAPFRPEPPPPPAEPESRWYSPVTNFAGGVWDGVKDPVVMVGGLVGLHGDVSDNWTALGGGLKQGVTHPLDFGKALIGWDDLSQGHYARWAGELVPGAAAAFFTGGAAAGVRGAEAVNATTRSSRALSKLTDAEKAELLARGGTMAPGSAGAVAAARYTTAGGRIDYSGIVAGELKNFRTITASGSQVLDKDLWLANLHDGTAAVNAGRSLKYQAPLDSVLADTRGGFLQKTALVPQWGPRTDMSLLRIPAGTEITSTAGTTSLQVSKHTMAIGGREFDVPTGFKRGGGPQVLLHDVDTDWVVWTGTAPWADGAYNVPRGLAVGGTTAVGTQAPDVLSDLAVEDSAQPAGSGSGD